MKIWQKTTAAHAEVDRFTVGRDREWDAQMAAFDVLGSITHATMLGEVGLLSAEESAQLCTGLRTLLVEVQDPTFALPDEVEDVHSFVEAHLTARLGEVGKKLHSARSRNDQVLVDLKLWLRSELGELASEIQGLVTDLLDRAEAHQHDLLPGYTHLQLAMPSSFGLWFGGHAESLTEDLAAFELAWTVADKNPLGSAAGFGSSFPIDRHRTAELLGFSDLNHTSTFAQMSRGRAERFALQAIASSAESISRLAMDCTLYVNPHFGFVSFPDEVTTGSSIMPHKKNPDVWELVRGHCNLLKAAPNEMALLMSNLPTGYHRDTQLTKDVVFPAVQQFKEVVHMVRFMIQRMTVKPDLLRHERYNELFTVERVNELVLQGIPFRDAYRRVGGEWESGSFTPPKTLSHTHHGSIGNPGFQSIRDQLSKSTLTVKWERSKLALRRLAEGSASATN